MRIQLKFFIVKSAQVDTCLKSGLAANFLAQQNGKTGVGVVHDDQVASVNVTPNVLCASTGNNDCNCGDFDTFEAQEFFLAEGGPTTDRHRLDANNDGTACETHGYR